MASDEQNQTKVVPITVLPPGSGNQIDVMRDWSRREEKSTADIMDRQTRRLGDSRASER